MWVFVRIGEIYLVTSPSSGGVYELTEKKNTQTIWKQQEQQASLPVLILTFGFFHRLLCFSVSAEFQVLQNLMMQFTLTCECANLEQI